MRRTHCLPTVFFLDYNVRKFFPQASLCVQTRDREELPAFQPSGGLTVYQRALSKLAEVCYRNESSLLLLPAICFIPCWLHSEKFFHLYIHVKAKATYSGVAAVTNNILVMDEIDFASRIMKRKSVCRNDML